MKMIQSLLLAPVLLVTFSAQASKMMTISPAQRAEVLKSAKVWKDSGPIAVKDLLNGPSKKFALYEVINNCRFSDYSYTEVADTGKTEKFWCTPEGKDPAKDSIKVKYDPANGEVFGEVVSSRLVWALGFFADSALPISVNCVNCPENPWKYTNYMAVYQGQKSSLRPGGEDPKNEAALYLQAAQAQRKKTGGVKTFEIALSEQKYSGTAITVPGDPKAGIGLNEVSQMEASRGGSTQAEIDALRLLVAFIKHGDNKAANQCLVCPDEYITTLANGSQSCSKAHLVLQDIGSTMGNGTLTILGISIGPTQKAKLSYPGWKGASVWKDKSKCQAKLGDNLIGGTLKNPVISEAGRKFLADLLMQLSDQQIADMFTAARVEKRQGQPAASVQQWVELFKAKRAEVVNTHCPR
jgi:hypothetical protein